MEINIIKQIYTFMIMNKIIYCAWYEQTRKLPNFVKSTAWLFYDISENGQLPSATETDL